MANAVIVPFDPRTLTKVGAPGVVVGIPLSTALATPAPRRFTWRSLIEYVTPFVRPVITTGLVT